MAATVHLFGTSEPRGIVTHCGLTGRGIVTTKFLHAVTCSECRRPGPPRLRSRPPIAPVEAEAED